MVGPGDLPPELTVSGILHCVCLAPAVQKQVPLSSIPSSSPDSEVPPPHLPVIGFLSLFNQLGGNSTIETKQVLVTISHKGFQGIAATVERANIDQQTAGLIEP